MESTVWPGHNDGRLLASKSADGTVRIWRTASWETVEILNEESSKDIVFGIAFHAHAPILATLGENDTVIRIWDIDVAALLGVAPLLWCCSIHHARTLLLV